MSTSLLNIKHKRNNQGSILVVVIVFMALLIALGTFLLSSYASVVRKEHSSRYAAQASAIAAASKLSNIVIADKRWGYVSLSDHSACGSATKAPDNEPLPVTGINTIIATVRLEKLIVMF